MSVRETTVTLSEPIEAHGETVTELKLRAPTGKDIRECGNPVLPGFTLTGNASTLQYDEAKMCAMMVRLAGVPLSSIDKLSFLDWTMVARAVLTFLAPEAPKSGTSSTDTTSKPGSGATSPTS